MFLPEKDNAKNHFRIPSSGSSHRITDIVLEQDVMLHFPYHSFNTVIDMLREAAIDPEVTVIKVTCYRLASNSKVINALINAVRNGKQVTAMMEYRARFDEEANLEWKVRLEEEGVKVIDVIPNMKVHSKLCLIKKMKGTRAIHYGFVSTGNLNEKTATLVQRSLSAYFKPKYHGRCEPHVQLYGKMERRSCAVESLQNTHSCPIYLRKELYHMINAEIKTARNKKPASITLKINSLSDEELIYKLYEAARAGVEIKLIVRGIFCMMPENKKFKKTVTAISILDEYLEHARVFIFHNQGKEKVYISSADWMVRNLDHRVEATCPVLDPKIRKELKEILEIQLSDNVKARWLDNHLQNFYKKDQSKKVRSQIEIYQYLNQKINKPAVIPESIPSVKPTESVPI